MIDIDKYFKPVKDSNGFDIDYEFQEHLTDHLLGDIIESNKTIADLRLQNGQTTKECLEGCLKQYLYTEPEEEFKNRLIKDIGDYLNELHS